MPRLISLILLVALLSASLLPCAVSEGSSDTTEPVFDDPMDNYFQQIAIINQNEHDIQGKSFYYTNRKFSSRGCGPACIVNTLITLGGMTDTQTSWALLKECMFLLCNRKKPANNVMDIRYLSYLTDPDPDESPVLYALMQDIGTWEHNKEEIDTDRLVDRVLSSIDLSEDYTLSSIVTKAESRSAVPELLLSLHEQGRDDAAVILTYVTGGTEGTSGAFRTSGGHYVTLYYPVGEWIGSGTFYLVDSLPRALKGEKTHTRTYWSAYLFLKGYTTKTFRETWTWYRINPTCIRFFWTEDTKNRMTALADNRSALIGEWTEQQKTIGTHGNGVVFIHLPGRES